MNQDTESTELACLPINKMQDVMLARFIGREEGTKLGFTPTELTHLATAISEITRNVVQHAGAAGKVQFLKIESESSKGLRIIVTDQGRGIEAVERYTDGSFTGNLGAGLPGTQRLVDHFQIESKPAQGTCVSFELWHKEVTP